MSTALLLLALLGATCYADDVILKPTTTGPVEIALVMIQGAQIPAERYTPLAQALQAAAHFPVWVGIPDFPLNTPEPLVIGGGISRVLQSMQEQGMNKTAKQFFTGHSLGGIMLQDYLVSDPSGAMGQVLMGSFLQRKYRKQTFAIPTMTIGGELDGLCHVTRIMEEFYHRIIHATDRDSANNNFPVVVVHGVSHLQFASGDPPELVKLRDLKPEISEEQAHKNIALLVSAFISTKLGDAAAFQYVSSAVVATDTFMKPLIAAYELEGSYYFKPPCYQDETVSCTLGSPWSERAQQTMGGLPEGSVNDTDVFHPVYQINPVHLPHVLNTTSCSTPGKLCVVNMTTVSQNVYDELDTLIDAGFVATSANEMRVKLKSRQVVYEAGGYKNVDFNKTDGSSICKDINQEAYNWAIQNANFTTLKRFEKYGVAMVMGEDKGPYNVGPVWIWDPLSYSKTKTSFGIDVIEVQSVMMRTPSDYGIKAAAGMHYCKLLSPARAMEWMYVDALREHYGINN
ncbi:uncharacterized protein LOC135335273 [Halichondria panicea]|uniref:uncharacterized protein LOC135335273 n=1 Tax=Halichondria panicea TaxID=6063 RepID=UPI00312B799D